LNPSTLKGPVSSGQCDWRIPPDRYPPSERICALNAIFAVLGPGEITRHRVLGAIALYLTLGMAFAGAYRLSWQLIPSSLANVASDAPLPQQYSAMLYFSFVTLTSVGYGDIVPVLPFVRALTNLEAIIGQLYPATLLARLVTLELEGRRRS
jgi:hypothetical protein